MSTGETTMTNLWNELDDAMLRIAQKIGDAVDRATGLDHWHVAAGLMRAMLALAMLAMLTHVRKETVTVADVAAVTIGIPLWLMLYRWSMVSMTAQRGSGDAGRSLKVTEKVLRRNNAIVWVVVTASQTMIGSQTAVPMIMAVTAFYLHFHFKAADMPPPDVDALVARRS